jgi:hypothetical protein
MKGCSGCAHYRAGTRELAVYARCARNLLALREDAPRWDAEGRPAYLWRESREEVWYRLDVIDPDSRCQIPPDPRTTREEGMVGGTTREPRPKDGAARTRRPPLADSRVREIWQQVRTRGFGVREVARREGLDPMTVGRIARGLAYADATRELREAVDPLGRVLPRGGGDCG